ncbi:MAG: bifunctional hydroxymethylpyrimidine kinase/phosphomethylpyrimidine kinase [Rhodospirillaceae bacterium]
MRGRVLIIAGSDSGGGAGIQADIKTVTALGGYAMTAITALTAQNTKGVSAIHEVPAEFVTEQIAQVMTDIGADAIKIGMLGNAEVVGAVAKALEELAPGVPVVLDPVMVAKGGAALLARAAETALRDKLIGRAALLTPNVPEAEVLAGERIAKPHDLERLGRRLLYMGAGAVLMKGGHMQGAEVVDVLVTENHVERFSGPRVDTRHTHGTGCTLASACAVGVAQGLGLHDAVKRAWAYVQRAIETAPGYGQGHGPLNHGHSIPD